MWGKALGLKPYHYVRFRWWRGLDLEEVAGELGKYFQVELFEMPTDERDIAISRDDRERLKVRADTLCARLSPYRATLYQREAAPFTKRDLELRRRLLELYPRDRPTIFPWGFSFEPPFEVEE